MRVRFIGAIAAALALASLPVSAQQYQRDENPIGSSLQRLYDFYEEATSGEKGGYSLRKEVENLNSRPAQSFPEGSRLSYIFDIFNDIDVPNFCRDPSAIKLWPNMPDDCVSRLESHLQEVRAQLDDLEGEIRQSRENGNPK